MSESGFFLSTSHQLQRGKIFKVFEFSVSPKPAPGDLEQFGFIEGEEGTILVRIKANPKPSFLWTVGRENIDEGNVDTTGHFEVGFAEPKVSE